MVPSPVHLRALEPSDAAAITRLLENDYHGVMQTSRIPWPFTHAEAEAFITRVCSEGEEAYAITVGDSGEFAGVIGVMPGDDPEIGYWIGKPFRNRGIASAAVRAVVARLSQRDVRRVRAKVFIENPASARVLEKCGFAPAAEVEMVLPQRGGLRRLQTFVLDVS